METILIVAGSGRMLAQAAKLVGYKPLVIDLFADPDTQLYAEELVQVNSLAEQDLAPVVEYFVERYGVKHVIYGSGFECYPESLFYLNTRLIILGNQADVFARLLDKQAFFLTLEALNIPYPESVFSAPDHFDGWLVKPMRGQGGAGIKSYQADDKPIVPVYWQKFQVGTPCSVLFLADGQQAHVVGFNSQWPIAINETQEFVFSGVINGCALSDEHKREVIAWLQCLVPVFALKGLNSLDFIHAGNGSYLLEINPRPSASMQLYDKDLLNRHIEATLGAELSLKFPRQMGYVGYQIVYAKREFTVPEHFKWPNGCMDLPKSGNLCRVGQPLCSIIARHINLQSVANGLLTKQQLIFSKLERF